MSTASTVWELQCLSDEKNRRLAKTDPVAFSRLCRIEPDPWQAAVLRSDSKRILLNCCRQSGKSTTMAVLALWNAIYKKRALVLVVSPSLRQSSELVRKVTERVAYLPIKPHLVGESKLTLEFNNGSRIVSLPATEATVRGFSAPQVVIEDEAGDVPDELHQAILPMLITSRGRLFLCGTPKGRRGHFFDYHERGGATWTRFRISADQCPRIDAAELAQQKLLLRDRYEQEYNCGFINASSGLVYGGFDELACCVDQLPKPKGTDGWSYLLGIDFGFDDHTAFVLLGYLPNDDTTYVVLSHKERGLTPSEVGDRVAEMQSLFHFTRIIGDTGGLGKGYAEEMRRRFHIPLEPADKQNKRGYIDLLNGEFRRGKVKILRQANEALLEEVVNLPWNEERTKEHPGFDNHLTDALLYIWRSCTTYLQPGTKPAKTLTPEAQAKKDLSEFWKRDQARLDNQRSAVLADQRLAFGEEYDPNDPFNGA